MFTQRSEEKELLDLGPDYYTRKQYIKCLRKLFMVNKLFGFFYDTVKILKTCCPEAKVLDIGCGGGLFILHLSKYFSRMQFIGSDISPEAIHVAQQELLNWQKKNLTTNVTFELQHDPHLELDEKKFDIILLTLVCHHLNDHDLLTFLRKAYQATTTAVIINDLQRHPLAYRFYAMLSPLLFQDQMITHDGLISIKRGFTRIELESILHQAGINNYQLKWRFPFRWQLILWKNDVLSHNQD